MCKIQLKRASWLGLLMVLFSAIVYADVLVAIPVSTPKAIAFNSHREPLWIAAQLLPSIIACLVLFTGLGARIRGFCTRLAAGRRFWTATLFACAYLILAALITTPFDYYRDVVDLRSWGELSQSPENWLVGEVMGLAVKLVIAGLFIWIPYALVASSPRRWWLYSALALVPVAFLVLVVLPVQLHAGKRHAVPGCLTANAFGQSGCAAVACWYIRNRSGQAPQVIVLKTPRVFREPP